MSASDAEWPYAALEHAIGHVFRDRRLCETALTHRSWANELGARGRRQDEHGCRDNERFEFLGDAVLGLVMADLLMARFPEQSEGELTRVRATLVNETGLERVAQGLDMGRWLFLGRGEEQGGGRGKRSIVADALEALLGAVYLDGGIQAAHGVVVRLFQPALEQAGGTAQNDFKSDLQEMAQARHFTLIYTVVAQHGPDHDRVFEVALLLDDKEYGRGLGKSKKEAQQQAAAQALRALRHEAHEDPHP
jgi:ribonuclease-3